MILRLAVRFLDNIIDINKYVLELNKRAAYRGRRLGLGIMGYAEYLFMKKIRYGSERSIYEIERLMSFIRNTVYDESVNLAIEKGAFPAFESLSYCKASFVRRLPAKLRMRIREHGIRNCSLMAIAPTGTISLLPEVSSGIEPLFSKAYLRKDRVSDRIYIHKLYKDFIFSNKDIPEWYVDSYDLQPEDHFTTQASFQEFVDGAISKTILLPKSATKEDLDKLLLEFARDLKGITIYKDGCRENQPLNKLTLGEVKKYLNKKNTETTSSLTEEDVICPTGSCEI